MRVLDPRRVSRSPWLSGFSAVLVLLAHVALAQGGPRLLQAGGWQAQGDEVALRGDCTDTRLGRLVAGRQRAPAVGPGFGPLLGLPAHSRAALLPAPRLGQLGFQSLRSIRPRANRTAGHSARGPSVPRALLTKPCAGR